MEAGGIDSLGAWDPGPGAQDRLAPIEPGADHARHPDSLLLEAEVAIEVRPLRREERDVVAGNSLEQPPHDRRPDALAAMGRCSPDIHQPGVGDTIRKQAGGRDDLGAGSDDGRRVAVLERPAQLVGRAAVVEAVGGQRVAERLPVDTLQVISDDDCRRQVKPPGRWASSGSG